MNIPIYQTDGNKIAEISLPEELNKIEVSGPLLHEVVTAYLANKRQGTASTKTRGEVSGGGAKPWRQKHTGRARVGSIRSPLWRKGGVVFGPKPRSYRINLPKKKRRAATKMALKAKISENKLLILKELKLDTPKTKTIVEILNKLSLDTRPILIVVEKIYKNLKLSTRNLRYVKLVPVTSLNSYDILHSDKVIFTENAMNQFLVLNSNV
ncbi:MAG: 50S ribosomal protein L4 [Elusimicrobiota bacterium]|nr:50S ribosomal protein L4 [Elusimicrobiota bacterium]